jgi:hypothetical protein
LKGTKHFRQESGRREKISVNLNSTQRYIESITQQKTAKAPKLIVPKQYSSPKPSPKAVSSPSTHNSTFLPVFSQTFSTNRTLTSHHITHSKPIFLHSSPRSVQFLSLQLDTGEPADNYVVNSYLRPKRLIGAKRKEQGHERQWSDVELYLRRFEHNEAPKESIGARKGVSGWKLSAVRACRSRDV